KPIASAKATTARPRRSRYRFMFSPPRAIFRIRTKPLLQPAIFSSSQFPPRPASATRTAMRAIVFDQPGDESVLRLDDVLPPPLGPRDLRIRVRATAVNRADLMQRQGLYPPPPGASSILGLECAGEVVEMGPEARGFRPGQRVMALLPGGGYAEEVVVHYTVAMPVPDGMSDEEAGAFPEVFLTVLSNLFMPGLGALASGQAALV